MDKNQGNKRGVRKNYKNLVVSEEIKKKFWSKADKTEKCWIWKGSIGSRKYGLFLIKREHFRAHILSYLFTKGDPSGLNVLHKCDNPNCVNPSHLFLGTQLDNMRDMIKKGRKRCRKKLTEEMVRMIKTELLHKSKNSQISKKYSISNTTIENIKRNKIWETVSI